MTNYNLNQQKLTTNQQQNTKFQNKPLIVAIVISIKQNNKSNLASIKTTSKYEIIIKSKYLS